MSMFSMWMKCLSTVPWATAGLLFSNGAKNQQTFKSRTRLNTTALCMSETEEASGITWPDSFILQGRNEDEELSETKISDFLVSPLCAFLSAEGTLDPEVRDRNMLGRGHSALASKSH